MINFEILSEKFKNVSLNQNKIVVRDELLEVLEFLKNTPEFDFDMLTSIIAVDFGDFIELIYQLYSSKNFNEIQVSFAVKNSAPTVINIYKSAYYDECEIYDLFGISFEGNENLKRLLLTKSWIGHPLLKSYKMSDERLVWND